MGRVTIPAPLGGVNLRDGIANIQSPEAVALNNLIPRPTCVETRGATVDRGAANVGGYALYTVAGHPSGNLVVSWYDGGRTVLRPFDTATNAYGSTYNATTANAPFWNTTLFQGLMILTNGGGIDPPVSYDGATTFTPLVITGHTAPEDIWGCQTFKGRVFYWDENAQSFWYAAAGAYQGVLTNYDLSTFTVKDGYLFAMVPLTIDGGAGPDDLAAFVFSTGEVLLFQGDDPGSATAWQQIGRFYIPIPIGPQCWQISGSATIISTEVGLVDLARALAVGPYDATALVGQQISGSHIAETASPIVRSQLQMAPNDNILIWARYPDESYGEGGALQVFVMDLSAKRWCVFTGWEQPSIWGTATAIGVCNNRLFVGDSTGYLNEYTLSGSTDSVGHELNSGTAIQYYGQCAYSDLGMPSTRKQIIGVNTIADADTGTANLSPSTVGVFADFVNDAAPSTVFGINQPRTIANQLGENWYRLYANGFRVSLSWAFNTTVGGTLTRARWYGTDVQLRTGGEQ